MVEGPISKKTMVGFQFDETVFREFSAIAEELQTSRTGLLQELIDDYLGKPVEPPEPQELIGHARTTFRIPTVVLNELNHRAEVLGVSRNQIINKLVEDHIERTNRAKQYDLFA